MPAGCFPWAFSIPSNHTGACLEERSPAPSNSRGDGEPHPSSHTPKHTWRAPRKQRWKNHLQHKEGSPLTSTAASISYPLHSHCQMKGYKLEDALQKEDRSSLQSSKASWSYQTTCTTYADLDHYLCWARCRVTPSLVALGVCCTTNTSTSGEQHLHSSSRSLQNATSSQRREPNNMANSPPYSLLE